MSDEKHNAAAYWKANLRVIVICLIVWSLCSHFAAILLRPLLSGITFNGVDLGFWFAQQGSILTFILLIFFYAWRMNSIDREFGLQEE